MDTNDPDAGRQVAKDRDRLYALLNRRLASARVDVEILDAEEATVSDVERYYNRLAVTPDVDTLVFFYSGHGGDDSAGRHHFRLSSREYLARSTVMGHMALKRPRLRVLLSNACASPNIPPIPPGYSDRSVNVTVLDSLFCRHRGVVDINAARHGTDAHMNAAFGGYFTRAFAETCAAAPGPLEWEPFFNEVARRTTLAKPTQHPAPFRPFTQVHYDGVALTDFFCPSQSGLGWCR